MSVLGLAAIHSPLTSLIKSDLSGLTFINSIPEFADSISSPGKDFQLEIGPFQITIQTDKPKSKRQIQALKEENEEIR